ncbi:MULTISPECIES: helix-turn-helix domain-containing protein [Microbacterium]|uniref:helix-turn-helix domain-containing protein n=1 Tax=Microbacterium TaxID=33882 RepID=UPI0027880D5A|nr:MULTISPECIES: helix-turn-helix domain-containing protein [Microbacterium]MDQ1084192.1 excisionase family DNA binding protein [Microbacterium sp. SORGH_AS_0344]MDQ1170533.1 excisionase family DNA binding protein [Microbacterium proteolyticum]
MTIETTQVRYLFIDEVAMQLRRSVSATRWLITSGQLKAGKVGGRVVVKPEDLDAFVESGFGAVS